MSKRIEGTEALVSRLSMNNNEKAARKWDQAMERLAADVTNTAYAVALAHGARGSWVDLELHLWKALARTVRAWGDPLAEGAPCQR
jgi:hypothetical protein